MVPPSTFSSSIKDLKNLPQRITIYRDGQKIMYSKTRQSLKNIRKNTVRGYNNVSWGADIEIELEIKVPKNMDTRVLKAVYGMVEIKNFQRSVGCRSYVWRSRRGCRRERSVGEIVAETNYGEIYTNFDTKFGGDGFTQGDFHTLVSAKPGSGPRYSFESKYGNVYVRKAQ
jgi:hypothetical protein